VGCRKGECSGKEKGDTMVSVELPFLTHLSFAWGLWIRFDPKGGKSKKGGKTPFPFYFIPARGQSRGGRGGGGNFLVRRGERKKKQRRRGKERYISLSPHNPVLCGSSQKRKGGGPFAGG